MYFYFLKKCFIWYKNTYQYDFYLVLGNVLIRFILRTKHVTGKRAKIRNRLNTGTQKQVHIIIIYRPPPVKSTFQMCLISTNMYRKPRTQTDMYYSIPFRNSISQQHLTELITRCCWSVYIAHLISLGRFCHGLSPVFWIDPQLCRSMVAYHNLKLWIVQCHKGAGLAQNCIITILGHQACLKFRLSCCIIYMLMTDN